MNIRACPRRDVAAVPGVPEPPRRWQRGRVTARWQQQLPPAGWPTAHTAGRQPCQRRGCGGAAAAAGARRRCCCCRWGWAACSPPKAGTGARAGRGFPRTAAGRGAGRLLALREAERSCRAEPPLPARRGTNFGRGLWAGRSGARSSSAAAVPVRERPGRAGLGLAGREVSLPPGEAAGPLRREPPPGHGPGLRGGSGGEALELPRPGGGGEALSFPRAGTGDPAVPARSAGLSPLRSPLPASLAPSKRFGRTGVGDFLPLLCFFSLALFPCSLGLAFEPQVLETSFGELCHFICLFYIIFKRFTCSRFCMRLWCLFVNMCVREKTSVFDIYFLNKVPNSCLSRNFVRKLIFCSKCYLTVCTCVCMNSRKRL